MGKYSKTGSMKISRINEPLVTVYITNYNYGRYIKKAIDSVLNQSFKNFELIIIDDGSNDNSKKIIERYNNHKKTISIFQKNKGLTVSNNIALRLSRGKYIMRLDADDWLVPFALEILSNVLEKNEKIGLVFPDYYEVNSDDKIIELVRRHDFKKVTLHDQPAHGACTMIRKKCLLKTGGYNEAFACQDGYDIWVKFIEKYGVVSFDLVTGFDESFGNSSEFRFSLGTEIIRVNKNLPIRIGMTIGGKQLSSYSLVIGFIMGPIKLDIARKYYNGVIRNRAQGAEYGVNLFIDF